MNDKDSYGMDDSSLPDPVKPVRRLRFGSALPPEPVALPPIASDPDEIELAAPRVPFQIAHPMKNLGITVEVIEVGEGHSAALWAMARGDTLEHYGKELCIGLIGPEPENHIRQVVVTLNVERTNSCFGKTEIGTIAEVDEEFGGPITISAFLLDSEPPDSN